MAQFFPLFAGMAARMRRFGRGSGTDHHALCALAHELRTPVSCMTGFAEMLLASRLGARQRDQVELIAQSGRQLLSLIEREIGGAGKPAPQQGAVLDQFSPEACNPRDLVQGCVRLLQPHASAKRLHLKCRVDDAVPAHIAHDAGRIRQVLLNLIGNAIKFTATGAIEVEVRVADAARGKQLQFAIIDSGIGIAPNRLAQIFRPFTQADASIAPRFGGSGLGLAISQRLAADMGGALTVHSQPGVGSDFTLLLPLVPLEEHQPEASPFPSAAPIHGLTGQRVLVAEDDGISRRLLLALSATLGLEICLAETGEEVIEAVCAAKIAGRPFHAVLMDLHMPGPTGKELAKEAGGIATTRRLRALGHDARSLPIIALTASCAPHEISACHNAGMQAHLAKPVTALALARELARCLPGDDTAGGFADIADLLVPLPSGRALQERYVDRKDQLLARLRDSLERQAGQVDWDALASDLHRIAGVAAHFGEANLGETSRRLETRIREAGDAQQRQRELRRAWPLLMQVA